MKSKVIAGVAVVLLLAACKPMADAKSVVSSVKSAQSGSAAQSQLPGGSSIRSVHTPGTEVDDMHLRAGQCHVRVLSAANGLYLPDPSCTPGATDPAVTQVNLASTICKSGYTSTVRPPASVTGKFKVQSLKQYGLSYSKTTEYDHLISLQLGGSTSVSNLWPEENRSAAPGTTNPKDAVEGALNSVICGKLVTLHNAQVAIATNWTTALAAVGVQVKVVGGKGKYCLITNPTKCVSKRGGSTD